MTSDPAAIARRARLQYAPDDRFIAAHSDDTASLFVPGRFSLQTLGSAFWLDRKSWEQDYIVSSACFVPNTPLQVTSHFTGTLRVWKASILPEGQIEFTETAAKLVGGDQDFAAWWAKLAAC